MEDEANKRIIKDLPTSIVLVAFLIFGAMIYLGLTGSYTSEETLKGIGSVGIEEIAPSEGVVLPVSWDNLGAQLVEYGVIDEEKFKSLYISRGEFNEEYERLLLGNNEENLKITKENSGYLLNLFWALGLASQNPILEKGEMMDQRYGGAQSFASTGGWTLARGNTMDHYSRHKFFDLTAEEQKMVERISKGIFRPCCGNSTHFPDCNHGMAMLGFIQLMVSQGVSEADIWESALAVNSYWFTDTYFTIASYLNSKGVDWKNANHQEVLGKDFSSSAGYGRIVREMQPSGIQQGAGCSV